MEKVSFLPRILSVFYAQFDVQHGPFIVCQVPEGLITSSPHTTSTYPSVPVTPMEESFSPFSGDISGSFCRSSRLASLDSANLLSPPSCASPSKTMEANKVLFSFDDISKYVIPPSPLCGKLVRCHTQKHRILGLPVELKGKYLRNYFRYNLCFVFDRAADSSCYDPIVRKINRVLTTCEEESGFLSAPHSPAAIQMACEQIYEDLSTFAETSISVDQFNSIELKSFPFFPNPPSTEDWMVPVTLIGISKRIEDNWDLTMVKVCRLIDGVNHVARIAQLAECDLSLTREAVSHLLYYQVVMTIDIFQFSNMYTLRRSIQWLAEEPHVKEECGPYVVKPGCHIPDWPTLLHLYSRMKPGKTILAWMNEQKVAELGIDVRRFASFGVIKGFLARVHRWPVYSKSPTKSDALHWRRTAGPQLNPFANSVPHIPLDAAQDPSVRTSVKPYTPTGANIASESANHLLRGRSHSTISTPSPTRTPDTAFTLPPNISDVYRVRQMSAAEKVLKQLRSRDLRRSAAAGSTLNNSAWLHHPREEHFFVATAATTATIAPSPLSEHRPASTEEFHPRRHTLTSPVNYSSAPMTRSQSSTTLPTTPRASQHNLETSSTVAIPPELISLLNGEHHTDELSVKFKVGWPILEQWLIQAGGGSGPGEYGRISVIYR